MHILITVLISISIHMVDFKSIPSFCINLDSRPDRWEFIRDQFDLLNWPVNRVSAVAASYPPDFDFRKRWTFGETLKPGQMACMESHRRAWKMAADQGCDVAAIFEDDALFPSDFKFVFSDAWDQLPSSWCIWHLHSFNPKQICAPIGSSKIVVSLFSNGYGSHGYLIKKNLITKFLSENLCDLQPVDWFLTKGVVDRKLNVYGTSKKHTLCFQKNYKSDIKETSINEYYNYMMQKYYR